jgi:hypothetical protein
MQRGILAVQTDAMPGHEDAFNAWYDANHVPEILETEGFLLGRRFRAVPSQSDPDAESGFSKYLAVYDIASLDLASSYRALLDRFQSGVMTPGEYVRKDPPFRSQLFEEILRRP